MNKTKIMFLILCICFSVGYSFVFGEDLPGTIYLTVRNNTEKDFKLEYEDRIGNVSQACDIEQKEIKQIILPGNFLNSYKGGRAKLVRMKAVSVKLDSDFTKEVLEADSFRNDWVVSFLYDKNFDIFFQNLISVNKQLNKVRIMFIFSKISFDGEFDEKQKRTLEENFSEILEKNISYDVCIVINRGFEGEIIFYMEEVKIHDASEES